MITIATIEMDPQPAVDEPWPVHEKDATGKWFRPRTGDIYPLFQCPGAQVGDVLTYNGEDVRVTEIGYECPDDETWMWTVRGIKV